MVGHKTGHACVTIDDDVAREAARSDPAGFGDGLFAVPIRSLWDRSN